MPEVSLTRWLDPLIESFAREAGIPTETYSAIVGGEGIGAILELIGDVFTKGWFNRLIHFITGLIAGGYATFAKGVPTRLRLELLEIGTHELSRVIDVGPGTLPELKRSIDSFVNAVRRGDWDAAMASILRTPAEIQATLAAMGLPVGTSPPVQSRFVTTKTTITKTVTSTPSTAAKAPSEQKTEKDVISSVIWR